MRARSRSTWSDLGSQRTQSSLARPAPAFGGERTQNLGVLRQRTKTSLARHVCGTSVYQRDTGTNTSHARPAPRCTGGSSEGYRV